MYSNCHYIFENNIKLDFQEVGCEGVDWVELAEDRERWRALGDAVETFQVP
jgi:hypothetical protein